MPDVPSGQSSLPREDLGIKEKTLPSTDLVHDEKEGTIVEDGLLRGLQSRHVSLISLASIIGGGVYYGFGSALHLSGPVGALIAFAIVAGGFIEHATRFVDPALGFSMAWMYYFMWSVFLGNEWNGAIIILQYWVPEETMPFWAWALLFFGFFSVVTTLGVVAYGEMEYYLGWFKILSLAVCFFLSLLVNVGAFGNGYIGFRYWTPPNGPIMNGINGFGKVFTLAAAYYVGTEIISLAAGETKDPQRAIPRGVNTVVYRIIFVYIGLIFFQGIVCPSTSPELLNASSKTGKSPFTIAFTQAGWAWAGSFINALIAIAFISSVNGCIYVQSRALYSLAKNGRAPRVFATTSTKGVPYIAIITSCCWGFLCLMNIGVTAGEVFTYMTAVGGTAAYIAWSGIIFTHLRVRSGLQKRGIDPSTFPFKAAESNWIYRINLCLNIFVLLIQGFTAFESPFDWRSFIASYITIPTTLTLFIGYKLYYKTNWVRLEEMNFSDRLIKYRLEEEGQKKFLTKIFHKMRR